MLAEAVESRRWRVLEKAGGAAGMSWSWQCVCARKEPTSGREPSLMGLREEDRPFGPHEVGLVESIVGLL